MYNYLAICKIIDYIKQIMNVTQNDNDFVAVAENLIDDNLIDEAILLLKESLIKMPIGWKPLNESPNHTNIYFWNEQEFRSFVEYNRTSLSRSKF